jgi:hypothetical protein
MSTFMAECPTVPVIRGSEVRFSINTKEMRQIRDWPLTHISCGEIAPDQPRLQWGRATNGARYDSFNGFRSGFRLPLFTKDYRLPIDVSIGARSSYVGSEGRFTPVEQQRVGVASITFGGMVRFKYWNDHTFWWWPMADGGDQADTAGVQLGYNLGAHRLSIGDWRFQELNLTLRLASGIPNRDSEVPYGTGTIYTEVAFSEVDRGDIDLHTTLMNNSSEKLEIGFLINSGAVRNRVQSKEVHKRLDIAEFPATSHVEMMMYLRWTGW